jgi:hypothetical protein
VSLPALGSLIYEQGVAAALAAPVATFAQSNQPVTRAQVRAELVRLEKVGYKPANGQDVHYPDDLQAAEAKVAAQNGATGVGGVVSGSSDAGRLAVPKADWKEIWPPLMQWFRRRRKVSNTSGHRASPSGRAARLRPPN